MSCRFGTPGSSTFVRGSGGKLRELTSFSATLVQRKSEFRPCQEFGGQTVSLLLNILMPLRGSFRKGHSHSVTGIRSGTWVCVLGLGVLKIIT